MLKAAAKKVKVAAKVAAPSPMTVIRQSAPAELKAKLKKLTPDQQADLFFKVTPHVF